MVRRLIIVGLVLAACAPATTPVTGAPETTTTPAPTTAAPSTAAAAPVTIPCGEATGSLLCEVYELIARHYVDPFDDADMARAAADFVAQAQLPTTDLREPCPVPSEDFVIVCQAIDAGSYQLDAAEEAAVIGVVTSLLDPNSSYLDPTTRALVDEEQSGQVEGIGALVIAEEEGPEGMEVCQVVTATCRLKIVSTIAGGPAEEAGLLPGDEFLAVDGESIEGWSIDQVTARVRGPAGTDVELLFLREGREFTVVITRAAIEVPVAESQMVGEVAYLRLNVFTDNADEQLRGHLQRLLANRPSLLVLDLRNNPGGLLETAINVTSEFISEGLVVTTESPEATVPYPVEPGGLATDGSLPLYVVVNRGSASASEVVAGALSDAGRAVIVGENTFGKNTVQQRFPLSNGGALKLTIARWLTPAGHDFGGTGIDPDVRIDFAPGVSVADLVAAVVERAA